MALIAGTVVLFIWELHPWMSEGTAIPVGNWRFGDCEFQVWQFKNYTALEPFNDALFVRCGANRWQAACFDIQDVYRLGIKLHQDGSHILVFSGRGDRGEYNLETHVFTPHGAGSPLAQIVGEPPGNYWR